MIAQGSAPLKTYPIEAMAKVGDEALSELRTYVTNAAQVATAAHVVEREVFRAILSLGHTLFGAFLELTGQGDLGETLTLTDGRVVKRLPELHRRVLTTVFGSYDVWRHAYGSREGQKFDCLPVDERLQLPEGEPSYLLQEWDQMLGLESAFGRVRQVVEQVLGLKQSVDTLEQTNQRMAAAGPAFRDEQPVVDPSQEGTILVATEDNKGVPMVRPVEEKPVGAHRTKGEKANKKQMACIGCVYSANPLKRTAQELVQILFRDADRPKLTPSTAKQKRYWVELTREVDGVEVRGQSQVFAAMQREISLRRKPGQVLVHLSDGQRSLETDRHAYLPRDENTVDVLDLMHVIPRLWQAAHVFHLEGSQAAVGFVRSRLLRVLEGKVSGVVGGLRQMATKCLLKPAARKTIRAACDFLAKNRHRMKYDEYLAAGYPVATGVIEGACRYVIKDRMERAGMRWKVPGAQAMLHLRAIHANGDWESYQKYRVEQETKRLYPNHKEMTERQWPLALAA